MQTKQVSVLVWGLLVSNITSVLIDLPTFFKGIWWYLLLFLSKKTLLADSQEASTPSYVIPSAPGPTGFYRVLPGTAMWVASVPFGMVNGTRWEGTCGSSSKGALFWLTSSSIFRCLKQKCVLNSPQKKKKTPASIAILKNPSLLVLLVHLPSPFPWHISPTMWYSGIPSKVNVAGNNDDYGNSL